MLAVGCGYVGMYTPRAKALLVTYTYIFHIYIHMYMTYMHTRTHTYMYTLIHVYCARHIILDYSKRLAVTTSDGFCGKYKTV